MRAGYGCKQLVAQLRKIQIGKRYRRPVIEQRAQRDTVSYSPLLNAGSKRRAGAWPHRAY